ncbi:hypothetical protein G6F59_016303 [Rhizopus arrhizus]|nr:hypothetical protein G6F59_016303 [Rhizopus arrhizus]
MHLARFNTTWTHCQWTLGGGVSVQSEIYQMQPIPTGRFTASGTPVTATGKMSQGGYVLFDLMGRYRINDNLSVGVTVTNLFDKAYYRNVGFFNSGYWGEPRRGRAFGPAFSLPAKETPDAAPCPVLPCPPAADTGPAAGHAPVAGPRGRRTGRPC